MRSDYEILGLSDDANANEIRKAYKKKVKELHPDASDESMALKNHYLFIEVCKAYERLCKARKESPLSNGVNTGAIPGERSITGHKDPAYVYYKKGCVYFEQVHPSHWNSDRTITINGKTKDENKLQEKTLGKVKTLIALFPKAYYYFSIVVHDYPDSVWMNDSREKMGIIEKRIATYKNILESFSTWNG